MASGDGSAGTRPTLGRGRSWVVVPAAGILIVLALYDSAAAQAPVTAATDDSSMRIVSGALRELDGDLQLRVRFSRAVPVTEINPAKGRFVCLVLDPSKQARRRVCVGRAAGRLRATMSAINSNGAATGRLVVLRPAEVGVHDDVLALRAPQHSLGIRSSGHVDWQARLTWDGACRQTTQPQGCTQTYPQDRTRRLLVRGPPRPAFVRRGHLRVLATGDSMIQIIDSFLKQRLEARRGTSVRSDARISTGLSKPFMLNWVRKAREQAQSTHPDLTVMFIGANDGFPMKTRSGASIPCCAAGWVAEYARRVESMMRSYLRGGRSMVYWLTLPTPRGEGFARVYRAVNAAIRRAGRRVGARARVIDLVPIFTPGGRFRQYVTFRGRTVSARQRDGVHLSAAGASIAATIVVDRLRADHALPPLR